MMLGSVACWPLHVRRYMMRRWSVVLGGAFIVCAAAFLAFLHPLHTDAATLTVTGNGDTIAVDALTTLREAITAINNQADVNGDVTLSRVGSYGTNDTINFNISGAGVKTINVTGTALPTITRPLTINGYTQGSASVNTLANSDNAVVLIELDGTSAGTAADGLTINASGVVILGLAIDHFPGNGVSTGNGITINSGSATISGNFIGTDPTGSTAKANGRSGIAVTSGSGTIIGTTSLADRNLISGNTARGVETSGGTGTLIQNNFVGTDRTGAAALGNLGDGVTLGGATETLGGTVAGARNVISGNGGRGVTITASATTVQGNYIGIGANGVTPIGNSSNGVGINSDAANNQIGGTVAGAGNLIVFNTGSGVAIGANAADVRTFSNAVLGNSILGNGGTTGIDLASDGITANGLNPRFLPNDGQNSPVLTAGSGITIMGTLDSTASFTFRIEFFSSPSGAVGGRNGQTFLGFVNVVTDGSGHANIAFTPASAPPVGSVFTATATNSLNDTSEFSAPLIAITPTSLPVLVVNSPASQQLTATGGTNSGFGFQVTGGVLPAGLVLDTTGLVHGTPTGPAGPYSVTVTVTDSGSNTGAQTYTGTVYAAVTVSPAAPPGLPNGAKGVVYPNQTISATGGVGPYTFTTAPNTLPPGLTLNPLSGVLGGTPTTTGTFPFTVTATDANGFTGAQPYTIIITASPLTGITLSCAGSATPTIKVGQTITCAATGMYQDGSTQPLPATQLTWSTDNPAAAVDANGNVTGKAPGQNIHIIATLGGVSGQATMTVVTPTFTGVQPAPAPASRPSGASAPSSPAPAPAPTPLPTGR